MTKHLEFRVEHIGQNICSVDTGLR